MSEIFYAVCDGEVVKASRFKEDVEEFAENSNQSTLDDVIERSGRDVDDLTVEELAGMGVQASFEGGIVYTDSIDIDDEKIDNEEFEEEDIETCNGDIVKMGDILEALALEDGTEDFEDDEFGYEGFDDVDTFEDSSDFEDFDNEDFEDYEEE